MAKATMLDALNTIGLDTLDGRFYFASELGQASVVDKMLKNGGVNINKRSSDGSTPLLIAARRGHTITVMWLLKVLDIEINNANGSGILHAPRSCWLLRTVMRLSWTDYWH